jgi:hypothetical protein
MAIVESADVDARMWAEAARDALVAGFRGLGLTVQADFEGRPLPHPVGGTVNALPTIGVRCRTASAREDHAAIYATLDELGWWAEPGAMARFREELDIVPLRHKASAALVVLLVTKPRDRGPEWATA